MFIQSSLNLLVKSYFIRPEFNLSEAKVQFGLVSQNGSYLVLKKAGHLPLQFSATVLCILSSLRLSGCVVYIDASPKRFCLPVEAVSLFLLCIL